MQVIVKPAQDNEWMDDTFSRHRFAGASTGPVGHHMMTSSNGNIFRVTGPLCVSPVNSPQRGQWHRALIFSLICAWINGSVNNREAGESSAYRSYDDDVIMVAMASQITSLTIVYSTVYSGEDQRKHQSSALPTVVWGIHRGPVN